MKLTEKQCKQNEHISTNEIEQDINDTQIEINQFKQELNILTKNPQENRLPIYMREGKIVQRKEFIEKLTSILEYRNSQ